MWLCTQEGFFSITRKKGPGPKRYFIRARKREDLANAKALCRAISRLPINDWPTADYRWRIIATERQMVALLMQLGRGINYSNFKDRIHQREDQREKGSAYSQLWGSLNALQEGGRYNFPLASSPAPRRFSPLRSAPKASAIRAEEEQDARSIGSLFSEPLGHRCENCGHEWSAAFVQRICPECSCHDITLPAITR